MKKGYRQTKNISSGQSMAQQVSMNNPNPGDGWGNPFSVNPDQVGLQMALPVDARVPPNPFDVLRQRLTDANNLGMAGQFFGVPDYGQAIANAAAADTTQPKPKKNKSK